MIRTSPSPGIVGCTAPRAESTLEPITIRISAAVRISGLSRSRIYELINSGDLEMHKVGRTTLIAYTSLKQLVMGNA